MAINRVEDFAAILKTLTDDADIQTLCQSELSYLRSELALSSFRRAATRYRIAIKEVSENHPALKFFKLTKDEQTTIKAVSKTQVYTDHTNLRPIDPDELILKACELLDSVSYLSLALGLMLLTGRRSTEVLKTAVMSFSSDDTVIFCGQLKTKGSENAQTTAYEIPVLTDSQTVLHALIRLRELKDFTDLTNDQVHSRCNKSLNEYSKKHFAKLIPDVKVKDLRASYATVCEHFYRPQTMTQTAYFAQILGHSKEDLTTAQSYQDFYIPV